MRPEIPEILDRVVGAAIKTLERPSGDDRRRDQIERIFEEVDQARQWPTDEPRRFVNERTRDLMRELRLLERLGPHGDAAELDLAKYLAAGLLKRVQADLWGAMQVRLRGGRELRK